MFVLVLSAEVTQLNCWNENGVRLLLNETTPVITPKIVLKIMFFLKK